MQITLRRVAFAGILLTLSCCLAHAGVITGTYTALETGWAGVPAPADPNRVIFYFSSRSDTDIYLYGKDPVDPGFDWLDNFAILSGVTSISEITDASIYTLQNGYGILPMGTMAVAQGHTGYWAAAQVIDIQRVDVPSGGFNREITLQWWYQTDGSADLSTPEPASWALMAAGLGTAALIRRRQARARR